MSALCLLPLLLSAPPAFEETGSLPSPHAHQAAVVLGKHVYAISSTKVAKYDRATGKFLGVSTGAAQHLNSGFVYDGKILCAHSNYPKKPEESDIRVLDPETMKLTIFHKFENPSGSLTWVVRVGESWYCTFAHYGADNARTILVRFDAKWKEQQRWKYPEAVINDWDRMSCSGGILDGDTWLTTGHHFKNLYRVRIPKSGDTLELVEVLESPIPGQGIAADPETGGIVGIDRKARRVVFARLKK